jgi:glucose/arabinose dehydrogenase
MNDRQLGLGCLGLVLVLVQGCTQREPVAAVAAAPAAAAMPTPAPDPLVFDTWVPGPCSPNGQPQGQCPPGDLFRVRLVPIAEGLRSPRHIAFTPAGDLLITELAMPAGEPGSGNQAVQTRAGHVRVVHDGKLAPEPLSGWPAAGIDSGALWSAVPHPQFAANRLVYLYYVKKRADGMLTRAVARARLEGAA